jgi:hypothetical protein
VVWLLERSERVAEMLSAAPPPLPVRPGTSTGPASSAKAREDKVRRSGRMRAHRERGKASESDACMYTATATIVWTGSHLSRARLSVLADGGLCTKSKPVRAAARPPTTQAPASPEPSSLSPAGSGSLALPMQAATDAAALGRSALEAAGSLVSSAWRRGFARRPGGAGTSAADDGRYAHTEREREKVHTERDGVGTALET